MHTSSGHQVRTEGCVVLYAPWSRILLSGSGWPAADRWVFWHIVAPRPHRCEQWPGSDSSSGTQRPHQLQSSWSLYRCRHGRQEETWKHRCRCKDADISGFESLIHRALYSQCLVAAVVQSAPVFWPVLFPSQQLVRSHTTDTIPCAATLSPVTFAAGSLNSWRWFLRLRSPPLFTLWGAEARWDG